MNRTFFTRILFYFFILIVFIFSVNTVHLLLIIKNFQRLPELPKPYEMMRFVINSYGDSSVNARFWFYDLQGNELASLERSWPADYLKVHFTYAQYNKKMLVYPTTIQNIQVNKKRQAHGTDLRPFVQIKTYTRAPRSTDENTSSEKALRSLEAFILDKNIFKKLFFSFRPFFLEDLSLSLERAERGRIYSLYFENGRVYAQ